MDWLIVVIEEYKTLRTEKIESMKMQRSILQYGAAAIGIVMIAGLYVWDKPLLSAVVFLFFLPGVVYLISMMWTDEVARMFRAGSFLSELEKKINSEFVEKDEALSWESWLLKQQNNGKAPRQLVWPHYIAILFLFITISIVSIVLGNFKLRETVSIQYVISIDILEATLFVVISIILLNTFRAVNRT